MDSERAMQEEIKKCIIELDQSFRPGVPRALRKLVRKYLCRLAGDLINIWRNAADNKLPLQLIKEEISFLEDLHRLAARGTLIEHFKHTEFTFGKGGPTALATLKMLLTDVLKQTLISMADCDAATKSGEAKRIDGMPNDELCEFVRQLPDTTTQSLLHRLKFEKIPEEVAVWSCWVICQTLLSNSFVLQMACVAIRPGPQSKVDLLIEGLEEADQALIWDRSVRDTDAWNARFYAMHDAVEIAGDFCNSSAKEPSGTSKMAPPVVIGRLPGLLVTMPGPWHSVHPQILEHFNDDLCPSIGPDPAQWEWLTKGAHYVLIFPTWLQYSDASARLQHLLRRLLVLTRAFRDEQVSYAVHKNDFHSVRVTESTPAKCRALTIPVEARQPFPQFDPPVDDKLGGSEVKTCAFEVAGHPFLTQHDLNAQDRARVGTAWKWLMDDCSEQGENARHAIECFDGAFSLGGSRGTMASEVGESWRLVAVQIAMEVLFSKNDVRVKADIDEGVRQSLKQLGLSKDQINRHASITRQVLSDHRNMFLHEGRPELEPGQLREVLDAGRLALRGEILRRAQKLAKLYEG